MITVIYKVEVRIPELVYNNYANTKEYDNKINNAIKGFKEAGQASYCDCYEWATFHNKDLATICERELFKVVAYFEDLWKEQHNLL